MQSIERMRYLCDFLNHASIQYYKYDNPTLSDKQYDKYYDELEKLEKDTGIIMNNSPTHKVEGEVLESLNKVKHSKPMLSAQKTKDIKEIEKFMNFKTVVVSCKLDGLTIVLRYKKGKFVQAITRGGGLVGEDVTHTIKYCSNVPNEIKDKVDIEVRGECIIPWDSFDDINKNLSKQYSHPRNLAAGTVRLLDSSLSRDRDIKFIAFELNQESSELDYTMNIDESFVFLKNNGFEVVDHKICRDKNELTNAIESFDATKYLYPVDGLIVKYNDYLYGKSLGETSHHPLDMIALKWEDQTYETVLQDVEWNTSKTGLINPTAIFTPVDLDGAITSRATLHNISYIENLELGLGDRITVYRSNMVVPKVDDNLDRSNNLEIPKTCPSCGEKTVILNENGSKTLHCMNDNCPAQMLSKLTHFVSKDGVNIDGLSEARLEKMMNHGYINNFIDIYNLKDYKKELCTMEGLGEKSVNKLIENIEKSRKISLENFISSLSIPLIGKSVSKVISKHNNSNILSFLDEIKNNFDFSQLDGFGEVMNESIHKYFNENIEMIETLMKEFKFIEEDNSAKEKILKGKNFVITGKVTLYKNRNELKKEIESLGGKVTGSVTSKTDYLINNDVESSSSKNKKAKELGIPIIGEKDFMSLL